MRIVSFLVSTLFLLAVVAGVGFLVGREVLLLQASSRIKSSLGQMRTITQKSGSYIQECRRKGAPEDGSPLISTVQLRFTSSTEYVVEVLCNQFVLDPIVVERQTLPWLVEKEAGTSGLVWGDELSGIVIGVLGRSQTLGVAGQKIVSPSLTEVYSAVGPVTSCSGYGYRCCADDTTLGEGESISSATDCPRSCFSSCQARPVVLALSTVPPLGDQGRTVTVSDNQDVTFNYVVDSAGASMPTLTFEFGDGSEEQVDQLQGKVTHAYSCLRVSCQYQARLRVIDEDGIESAQTSVAEVEVIVRAR